MKSVNSVFVFIVFAVCTIYFTGYSIADTIITKDGKEIKGIVIEDYKDRIVFSTVEGETTVMKSDIRELLFDSEEGNLIKLAQQAIDRRDYPRAMNYYEMAQKANPDSAEARQGMVFLRGSILRSEEQKKIADTKRQEQLEASGGTAVLRSEADEIQDMERILEKTTGMTIVLTKTAPEIASVKPNSPAYEAGLRKGDLLVSVWEKLTGYLSRKEILDLLINKSAVEIRSMFERTVSVGINRDRSIMPGLEGLIGAQFAMLPEGLTITAIRDEGPAIDSGLQEGDMVMAIDGQQTRYMPLKKAIESIQKSRESTVQLTIKRKAIIWRRSEI